MSSARAAWLEEDVEPAFEGFAGRVWRFSRDGMPADTSADAGVGESYLVFAPQAHPLWSWHVMMAVALRDVPGMPPAYLRYPGAEYELMVLALNPEHPAPDPRRRPGRGELHTLMPPDVVVQFHDVPGGDVGVKELMELCAAAIAQGVLVPDSDHRGHWERSIAATLQHARSGARGLRPFGGIDG